MNMRTPNPIISAAFLSSAAFVGIIIWIGNNAKSAAETALASVLLTLVSVIASWVVAHYYYLAEKQSEIDRINEIHHESLRTYALKAAEKVTNLSNELARLSTYLRQYIEKDRDESDIEVIIGVRDERISAAIHIVEMLRSVNDTSLSDWEGVIGDELGKKKEIQEEMEIEREERLGEIVDKIDILLKNRPESEVTDVRNPMLLELHEMREDLARELYSIGTLLGTRQVPPVARYNNQEYSRPSLPCPQCGDDIRIRISKRGKVVQRSYICINCKARLVARANEDGAPYLEMREEKQEKIQCPSCSFENVVLLDNIPGTSKSGNCTNCLELFMVNRTPSGISVTSYVQTLVENEDLRTISNVRGLLPAQPWPKGTADYISEKLGLSKRDVSRAIQVLINIGVFRHQVAGEMFDTAEEAQAAHRKLEAEKNKALGPPVPDATEDSENLNGERDK